MSKISGPLLDRIDLHLEVPAVPFQDLSGSHAGTSSATMRDQVTAARRMQAERFAGLRVLYNAHLTSRQLRQFCPLDEECRNLLKSSVNEMGLSARAHDKVVRVARTIADLDASERIQANHIEEAVNYRLLDRQMWT